MKIETKFAIGERVYFIAGGEVEQSVITGIFINKAGHEYQLEGMSFHDDSTLYKAEKEAALAALSDKEKSLKEKRLYHLDKIKEIDNILLKEIKAREFLWKKNINPRSL